MEVLTNLFERNIVNCLNLYDRYDLGEGVAHQSLALSCTFIWEYFSSNPWKSASHKVDFMIDFLNRRQLAQVHGHSTKIPYEFPELDALLEAYQSEPDKVDKIITNNLNVLSDSLKDILNASFFEQINIDKLALDLNQSDEYIEKQREKGFAQWIRLIRQNANYRIAQDELLTELPTFIGYHLGELSKTKMLDFEMKRSSDKATKDLYNQFLELVSIIKWNRRNKILESILANSTTKLTGNIWGNRWSLVSAGFIILIGILIWYTDNYVEVPTEPPGTSQNAQDTTNSELPND